MTAIDQSSPPLDVAADEPSDQVGGSIWTLFVGLALLMVGNGLNGALIGVRSTTEGFGVAVTGVVTAGFFAGFLLAPSVVVRAISSVGHIRVFAGLASTASSAVLVQAVSVVPISWVLMRFVFGFCFAGIYIVIESWLNELATPANRGTTLSIYMAVSMGGLGVGQYLISVADPSGFRLFVLSSFLVSMSLVPITLAGTTKAPEIRAPEPVPIRVLLHEVPTGVVGAFMTGVATGVVLGFGAVYASRVGLSLEKTAGFLFASTLGGVVMQYPVGKLSDRVRRRVVIFGVASAGVGLSALGVMIPPTNPVVLLVMFGIGGCLYPLHSLMISYTLDWMGSAKSIGASASLIRLNGAGALTGPLVTAPVIGVFGPDWFFWIVSGAFAVVVVFILYRIVFREAVPKDQEGAYVPFPARAGQLAFDLVVRPVRGATRTSAGRHVISRHHGEPSRVTELSADGPIDPSDVAD